jgi:hypothetical protein
LALSTHPSWLSSPQELQSIAGVPGEIDWRGGRSSCTHVSRGHCLCDHVQMEKPRGLVACLVNDSVYSTLAVGGHPDSSQPRTPARVSSARTGRGGG